MSRLFLIVALVMAKSLLVGALGLYALSPAMANPCNGC